MSFPEAKGPQSGHPNTASRPRLVMSTDLTRFLAPTRSSGEGFAEGGPRFRAVRAVTRCEVRFENGLGRSTRGAHLLWGAAADGSDHAVHGGEFLMFN